MGNKREAKEVLLRFFNNLKNCESVPHSEDPRKHLFAQGQMQTELCHQLGKQQGCLVKSVNVAIPKMIVLCENPRPFCNWTKFTCFMKSEFPDLVPDKCTHWESESSPQVPMFSNLQTFLDDMEKSGPQVLPFYATAPFPGRQTALCHCWVYTRGWLVCTGHGCVKKKPCVDPSWIQLGASRQEMLSLFVLMQFLHDKHPDLLLFPSNAEINNVPNDPCGFTTLLTVSNVEDDSALASPLNNTSLASKCAFPTSECDKKKRKHRTKSELGCWPLKTPCNLKTSGINADDLSPNNTMCPLCTTM